MDRCKNMCFNLVPVYYGGRPVTTRGVPNISNDYYFQCYASASINDCGYRQANTIEELCNNCKKYNYIKPLSKEEIQKKYGSREVLVVTTSGWHYKTL